MNEQSIPQPSVLQPQPPMLPSSTLATVSMVAGILGFTAFPLIGTVVALVTGYMARKETRSIPPVASGDGMATAGIVMGWIQVGLMVVGLCCVAASLLLPLGLFGISSQGR